MAEVEWSLIDQSRRASVTVGELVSMEAGGFPIYEVMAAADDRLWLRDTQSHRDHVLPAQSLRWRLQRRAAAAI